MILDVKNLHHSYGEVEALNNLNFSIKDSSIVSVLCPSGCGKTTLIRVIAGLESVQKGEIFLEDNIDSYFFISLLIFTFGKNCLIISSVVKLTELIS